jgi:hypothetical protein
VIFAVFAAQIFAYALLFSLTPYSNTSYDFGSDNYPKSYDFGLDLRLKRMKPEGAGFEDVCVIR